MKHCGRKFTEKRLQQIYSNFSAKIVIMPK